MRRETVETEVLLDERRRARRGPSHATACLCAASLLVAATLAGAVPGVLADQSRLGRFGFQWTERYATLLRCGGRRYLLTRMDHYGLHKFVAVVRRDGDAVAHVLWNATRAALNPTLACVGDRPHVVGSRRHDPVVWMLPLNATRRELESAIPLNLTGCVERFAAACQFDSKFSLVQLGSRWLLYIRANLCAGGGCRHVQVAESHDRGRRWLPFRAVRVEGVPLAANVYFFDAFVGSRGLSARFPMVNGTDAGVYETHSRDGHRWERPVKIVDAAPEGNRTHVHPVGGTHLLSINLERHYRDVAMTFDDATTVDLSFRTRRMNEMRLF